MNNTSSVERVCFRVDIFPLFVFTFVVNIFALLAVLKTRPTVTTSNAASQVHLLICCLSSSDTVSVGLQCLMPVASFVNCGWWGGQTTCAFLGYISAIFILWSGWIVAILGFQRFLLTVYPLRNRQMFTTKRIKQALFYLFVITCFLFSPPLFGVGEFVYYDTGQFCSLSLTSTGVPDTVFLSVVVANGFVCVILVLFFNIRAICSLRSRKFVFHAKTQRAVDDSISTFVSLTKAVALVFCLCNTPFLIRIAVDLGKQTSKADLGIEHTLTMALIFANNLANPFIYVACRKRYRNSLKLLCFGYCSGDAVEGNSSAFVGALSGMAKKNLPRRANKEPIVGVKITSTEVCNINL